MSDILTSTGGLMQDHTNPRQRKNKQVGLPACGRRANHTLSIPLYSLAVLVPACLPCFGWEGFTKC